MSLGSGGGRSVCLWRCCLLSVPLGEQASGRRWDCSGLGHVARRCFGTKWYGDVPGARSTRDGRGHVARRCFGTKWYGDVPGARSTRDGDTGNEDNSSFARFFKLDKYAMFSFAMTSGSASDFDKFKIIITLRRVQKFWNTGPFKIFDFLFNRLPAAIFFRNVFLPCSQMGTPAELRLNWRRTSFMPKQPHYCIVNIHHELLHNSELISMYLHSLYMAPIFSIGYYTHFTCDTHATTNNRIFHRIISHFESFHFLFISSFPVSPHLLLFI